MYSKIVEAFPKLEQAGGHEFMQTQGTSKFLNLIPRPPEGYTAMYLKTLGSSRVYIRPIQQNLGVKVEEAPSAEVCFNIGGDKLCMIQWFLLFPVVSGELFSMW